MAQVRKNLECQTDCLEKKADRIGDAIEQAIYDIPNDFEIRKFIVSNKAEVKDMCLTEYNEAETMEMLRQEAIQEGIQEGIQKGRQETLLLSVKNLMESTGWTADKIMEMLKIPLTRRLDIYAELSKDT